MRGTLHVTAREESVRTASHAVLLIFDSNTFSVAGMDQHQMLQYSMKLDWLICSFQEGDITLLMQDLEYVKHYLYLTEMSDIILLSGGEQL